MKICLVAAFPPSGRQLNEYALYIARELQRTPGISLTILADELADYEFATDENGKSLNAPQQPELPGFDIIRCWKFNSTTTPVRLLRHRTQIEARCGVVQPRIFELCYSRLPGCGLCGSVRSRSDARSGLLHSCHPAPHHRTRRFCQDRSAPGKDCSVLASDIATEPC